ncbi:hypothetical protein EON82_14330 [bacterium]|nr:MAG: hypothetical protein EON82_14330 [bacterium]
MALTLAEFVNTMNRGQYLILAEAVRQAGGSIRIEPREFADSTQTPLPELYVDATDGPVVMRLAE